MPPTIDMRTLPAEPEALATLHLALSQFWGSVAAESGREVPMRAQFAFTTGASEVAANIIRYAEAESFDLTLLSHGGRKLEALFFDRGVLYTPVVDPGGIPDGLAEGGFGLALARRVVDTLEYERTDDGVNCWSLVVHLPPAAIS